jgi:LmbE family N-acetylglucosaminyl deacetylase
MKDLFVFAHPDDGEVMEGYAIADSDEAYVAVGSDGEASTVDMIGSGFCPGWRAEA